MGCAIGEGGDPQPWLFSAGRDGIVPGARENMFLPPGTPAMQRNSSIFFCISEVKFL